MFEFKRDPQPAWPRPASTRRGLTIEFSGLTIVDVPRALILDSLLLPKLPARERPKQSSSALNTIRSHHLIPVIPIGHRRLSNQRCYPVVTRRPGQRFAQALIRPPGSNRVSLLYARVSERVAGAASFLHSNRREYGRSNLHNDHNEGVSDGLAVCDRGSDGPCSCNARLLHPINSESIMAGRRSLISRSTSHVPAGI